MRLLWLVALFTLSDRPLRPASWRPSTNIYLPLSLNNSARSGQTTFQRGFLPYRRSYLLRAPRRRPYKYRRMPRQVSSPLTMSMCRSTLFSELKSCKSATASRTSFANRRKQLMGKYLCWMKDKWDKRKKPTRRSKRATNECQGVFQQKTVLLAREADRPWMWRELLHDPKNFLCQTIYSQQCEDYGPYGVMHCRMHDVMFKAAVWSLTSVDDVEVLNVITEGYCALTSI